MHPQIRRRRYSTLGRASTALGLRLGCSVQRVRVRLLRQHAERLERQLPVRKLRRLQQRVEVEGVEEHWLRCRQPAQLVEWSVSQPKAQQREATLARVGTLEGRFREQRVKPLAGRREPPPPPPPSLRAVKGWRRRCTTTTSCLRLSFAAPRARPSPRASRRPWSAPLPSRTPPIDLGIPM